MKNQFKKSLSLIMAVLMLMSCWVWVAPEKAEAGEKTQYYMKITTNVTDTGNENGSTITINYKDTNGQGDTGTFTQSYGQQSWDGQVTVYSGPIDGWPTSFSWTFTWGSVGRAENHRDITVYIGGTEETCTHQIAYDAGFNFKSQGTGTTTHTCNLNITGTAPYFYEVTSAEATATTLNKLPNGADATATVKATGGKDQYGVVWKAPLPTSGFSYGLKYTDNTGAEKDLGSSYGTISSSTNSATAYIKDDFQKLFPNAANGKIQAYCYYGSSTASATINVDFPTYKATFDSNGGLIGPDSATGKTSVEVTHDKMYYDSVIGKQPAFAAKEGFDFKGFYSTKISDATGATFTPSGTKFEDSVTKVPGNGDTTWYAAWQALPITATFVTQDGQLIGTVEGRYNNYLTASNMYGDTLNATVKAAYTGNSIQFDSSSNAPVYKDGSTTYTFAGWKIIEADNIAAYDGIVDMNNDGKIDTDDKDKNVDPVKESPLDKDEDFILRGNVTFQATYTKASAATYTVKFKNAEGNVISEKSGYKYRDDVTNIPAPANEPTKAQDDKYSYDFIGWAKDIGKNFYIVDETDRDENGATVVYTHKEGASFVVKGDATYVPVFRMTPREYSVTYNYTVDGGTQATEPIVIGGYHWHDGVKAPEIKDNYTADGYRYYLIGWNVGNDTTVKQLDEIVVEGDTTLTAVYGNREAAKYTINFYGKAEDGKTDVLLNEGNNIYEHDSLVTAPEVPQIIDTAESLYTFAGWSPAVNTPASGDADYYATYTKKDYADLHFYNYDGTLIYELKGKENGLFVGETIPAYEEATYKVPVKAEDAVGTYTFAGWADSQGNTVDPGTDVFTGDTHLYAQFTTSYKEYTVKFVNDVLDADGNYVVVSENTYHYGDPVTIPTDDPTKVADVEYKYEFKFWSPDVSAVCNGNATYTAVYSREHQYYAVTWLKDNKQVFSSSNYKYNAKIQQAVINNPVSYDPPADGMTWALKHWVQCDASGNDILVDGEQVIFVRGQRMLGEALYFYPVFEEVPSVYNVEFFTEDGATSLGTVKVPHGARITDYDIEARAKAAKAPDETNHYVINKWVNFAGAAVETATEDVKVKATYTAEAHKLDEFDVIIEPTCTEPGLADVSCSNIECGYIERNVELDLIPDDGKPTGQFYVGDYKWTLADYEDGIDYSDIKYVGPKTVVIVNAEDTNNASDPWNLDGKKSRGVGKVEYYVSEEVVRDLSTIVNWNEIYNYEETKNAVLNQVLETKGKTMQDYIAMSTPGNKEKKAIDDEVKEILATYNANATGILSNLNLVNGKEYIIYIRISDREVNGQSNKSYLSSGTLHYGSTAAEITVTGDGYGTKFCADATIKVTDDTEGFTVYLDNEVITLDTNGEYKCEAKGSHTVTVIDKHGNITTKTLEIKGDHTNRQYVINATCEKEGSRYNICTVCGAKTNEEVLPAIGHSYTENYIDKAPTCDVNGYRTYVCDNNCGTKLVIKPTDDAATIAQAKKFVEPAEGEEEGKWVDLTADDIKHLKATGEHTYAMVKDENGEDTAEYVWVIDKAATCSVKGSKHRDCTVCGRIDGRVTEEIPFDEVNGHKFYRERVTLEPTCTEKGAKTKTCRYCGVVVKVADIDALGHEAGEYKIINAANCEEKGSKILTCARCGVDIGEPIKDDKGNVTGYDVTKTVEIPALGHAWKIDGDVWQATEETADEDNGIVAGKWYQNYVCANDKSHTKVEEKEGYEPPVPATVTFKNGDDNFMVIEGYVTDVITAAEITEEPTKAADATYNYTFKGWATKNADGTYTEVKFPIEVKGDATYYAVYTEKYVNYTITYYKEDGATEFKKTGYLHNDEEVTLADAPSKAETTLVKYEFAGWVVIGSDPEVVYTDKATIKGANINLKAKYTANTKQYVITYAYSKSDILETFEVEAGSVARDCAITPSKKADSKYHYDFKAWNKAEQLKNVESNIYTTPDFEAILHEYTVTVKTAATCDANRVDTYTCACGYTYDKEISGTKREHDWGDRIVGADGSVTRECKFEDCDAVDSKLETFTAKFFVDAADENPIKTVSHIDWGTTIEAMKLPATPSKAPDETYTYTFKGWAVKGTTDVVDFTKLEIKMDYDFVAIFTPTLRKYTVIFAYDAYNVIKTYKNVDAGSAVTFDGAIPTKVCDETKHYTFSGWKGYTDTKHNITITNIQSDLYITANFAGTAHKYATYELEAATCTNGTGTRYWCDCNGNGKFDAKVNDNFVDHYNDVTGKPLPHNFEETNRVPATALADGYVEYTCTVCGTVEKETLKYVDNIIEIKVTVTVNGAAKSGIQVEIQPKDGIPFFATTNAGGVATAEGTKGVSYTAYATIDGDKVLVTLKEDGNGNLIGSYNHEDKDADCTCACHRNNVWGAIFRFFHKIIKLFTGKFKCCGNPDPMYG